MGRLFRLMLACVFLVASFGLAEAKPPGGGFRSSSSSFRSMSGSGWGNRSKPSVSSNSGWGSKSSTKASAAPASKSTWSTSRPDSSKPAATSAVDAAAYKKAKESGKSFTTPQAAAADFKAKSATKYSSTYKSEPAKRPTHIPQATTVGGKTVNVTYNAGYGGYGYMHPTLGTWMMYDMMSDAVMMNTMMRNDGYYVGPAPVQTVSSAVGWCILTAVLLIFIVLFIASLSET